jgi:UDP-N-acetylglucosamine acyltransferase
MVGSHVAHDCQVGNDVTFANLATLGGHVSVGDNVIIGGLSAVHQFVRVGEGVMVGGLTAVRGDIIPFGLARTEHLVGLNVVGLRRRGVSRDELRRLRRAYRFLFMGTGAFADRLEAVASEFAGDSLVSKIVAFIRADNKRSLMQPRLKSSGDEQSGDAA